MTSSTSSASSHSGASKALQRRLNDTALAKLTATGSLYPTQFRSIMQHNPSMRTALEAAVLAQKEATASTQGGRTNRTNTGNAEETSESSQKPSIKLKMDFSNFKS